jgi:hypothetical protein
LALGSISESFRLGGKEAYALGAAMFQVSLFSSILLTLCSCRVKYPYQPAVPPPGDPLAPAVDYWKIAAGSCAEASAAASGLKKWNYVEV